MNFLNGPYITALDFRVKICISPINVVQQCLQYGISCWSWGAWITLALKKNTHKMPWCWSFLTRANLLESKKNMRTLSHSLSASGPWLVAVSPPPPAVASFEPEPGLLELNGTKKRQSSTRSIFVISEKQTPNLKYVIRWPLNCQQPVLPKHCQQPVLPKHCQQSALPT